MQHAKAFALLIWLAAAIALGVALALQYGFGHEPCHLCLYERLPYYALLVLIPVSLALGRPGLGLGLAAVLLLGNAGLSFYHAGVEQGWFALPSSCMAGGTAGSIDELRDQLMAARPTCDQVSLSLLGLSLAVWNGLLAGALGLSALAVLLKARSGAEQDRQRGFA